MSPPSESDPLLPVENGSGQSHSTTTSLKNRILHFVAGSDGEPTWLQSLRFFFLGSYFNVLLLLVPLGGVAHYANWDAGLRFLFNFLAIIPLARLLGVATDQLSVPLGEVSAGLLSATFGNAVEIIVGAAALFQDQLKLVQTSLVGSVLSNILLVMGCSFIGGGLNTRVQRFGETGAQMSSSLMLLSVIALVLPAAYHFAQLNRIRKSKDENYLKFELPLVPSIPDQSTTLDAHSIYGLRTLSHGTAILLLVVYIGYLFFQLKTHARFFKARIEDDDEPPPDVEVEETKMNAASAAILLLSATVLTSFSADWLVASIQETALDYHIPEAFIGIVLLPIVANAAEHITSVWMAVKGKTEMSVSICVGSSIQIIAFVIPLLVVVGWISGHNLTLAFEDFETITLFVSVLLVNTLIMDGKTHYMEGLILVVLYVIIAIAYWVS